MEQDIYYQNQKLYCENNKLPLFSHSTCDHSYGWNTSRPNYGQLQTLGEMLVNKYGSEEAFIISASTHIISCPSCNRSWCD